MYNIGVPSSPPLDDYDFVLSHRNAASRERLKDIRPDVAKAYDSYTTNATPLKLLSPSPFSEDDRTMLRKNFQSLDKGAACVEIRNEILASTRQGRCPYCRLEEATTLDHILEKKTHPEFSILRPNLAPVCSRCNLSKEHNSKVAVGRELFHLYFQGYPLTQFLVSTPEIQESGVAFNFFLQAPAGIDPSWWEAVDVHFQRIDLAARYQSRAQTEMQDRRDELLRVQAACGSNGVEKYLRSIALSVSKNWSQQDWLCVLLTGAADSKRFCDEGVRQL
ncbi:5-methylcytosine-specific restriction endonuclease McrA [Rhodococcus erythropolis]|uniref:HNH endonuclease n=1 Tax=Rhodococcus erythropolis TaxID=1833 RepID=UPI0021691E65|nr:HNH endonuclease signature motif containing protein [Rhodococcus erythropolis]MCS4255955.1 5-methylcytosine-specific restriction endonuclease McrA [Rhodococcus erythropolis]MCW2425472.1 5-methylcytosine-specific restriction endonuclease McrA [Rhodococcus erythropolis]